MLSALSTLLTLGVFFFTPKSTVALPWVVLFGTVSFTVFAVLADLVVRLSHLARFPLPRVRVGRPAPAPYGPSVGLLLLEPSEFYGQSSIVSIFCQHDEYEELIGIGYVMTIQENGLVQIVVLQDRSSDAEIWKRVRGNDAAVLRRILVKPSVSSTLLVDDLGFLVEGSQENA